MFSSPAVPPGSLHIPASLTACRWPGSSPHLPLSALAHLTTPSVSVEMGLLPDTGDFLLSSVPSAAAPPAAYPYFPSVAKPSCPRHLTLSGFCSTLCCHTVTCFLLSSPPTVSSNSRTHVLCSDSGQQMLNSQAVHTRLLLSLLSH